MVIYTILHSISSMIYTIIVRFWYIEEALINVMMYCFLGVLKVACHPLMIVPVIAAIGFGIRYYYVRRRQEDKYEAAVMGTDRMLMDTKMSEIKRVAHNAGGDENIFKPIAASNKGVRVNYNKIGMNKTGDINMPRNPSMSARGSPSPMQQNGPYIPRLPLSARSSTVPMPNNQRPRVYDKRRITQLLGKDQLD